MLDPTIINIASTVRSWAEQRAARLGDSTPSELDCYCGIASTKMSLMLNEVHIGHRIALSQCSYGSHAFVLVNNYIVDVTATQFGEEDRIFVRHSRHPSLNWYHRFNRTFKSARSFITTQIREHWPDDQIITKMEWATV
jgi:hypothetical protein